jgi:hypothetical protein
MMVFKLLRFCLLGVSLSLVQAQSAWAEQAPYAFKESAFGQDYKKLVHNLLGFSIDMPRRWTFGVAANQARFPVVVLYPEDLNVGVISSKYETVVIGLLPLRSDFGLEQIGQWTLTGLRAAHPDLEITQSPTSGGMGDQDSLYFALRWVSKNGTTMHEPIALVHYKTVVYSVTVRAAGDVIQRRGELLRKIAQSFRPQDAQVNRQYVPRFLCPSWGWTNYLFSARPSKAARCSVMRSARKS